MEVLCSMKGIGGPVCGFFSNGKGGHFWIEKTRLLLSLLAFPYYVVFCFFSFPTTLMVAVGIARWVTGCVRCSYYLLLTRILCSGRC